MTMFGPKKNRRRVDPARRTAEVKAAVARRAPGFFRAMLAIVLTGGVVAGGWQLYQWALSAPQFALERLDWYGTGRATPTELARLSGLTEGQNLLSLDLAQTERAIAQHPWLKSVRLTRHLPHRLSVHVEEHQPVALASLGELYLIDGDGRPFKKLAAGDRVDLPLVSGLDRESWTKDPQAGAGRLRTALAAIDAFDATRPQAKVSEARLDEIGVSLVLSTGLELKLGDGDFGLKLERLARVQKELQRQRLAASVVRLDHRTRPGWVTVQLTTASGPEKGSRSSRQ